MAIAAALSGLLSRRFSPSSSQALRRCKSATKQEWVQQYSAKIKKEESCSLERHTWMNDECTIPESPHSAATRTAKKYWKQAYATPSSSCSVYPYIALSLTHTQRKASNTKEQEPKVESTWVKKCSTLHNITSPCHWLPMHAFGWAMKSIYVVRLTGSTGTVPNNVIPVSSDSWRTPPLSNSGKDSWQINKKSRQYAKWRKRGEKYAGGDSCLKMLRHNSSFKVNPITRATIISKDSS